MYRSKIAGLAAAAVALGGLAAMGAGPVAHASTTEDGCTVRPYAPTAGPNNGPHGRPMVRYKVDVTCPAGVNVELKQQLWEQDLQIREGNSDDEYFGTWTTDLTFTSTGTQTVTLREECPSTGTVEDGTEEVYQAVQFEVSIGSVGGGFTDLELTQPTTIWK